MKIIELQSPAVRKAMQRFHNKLVAVRTQRGSRVKIIELQENEQPSGEPGVYIVKGTKLWAFVPAHVNDMECVPYQWGRDFPEIEAFMARFPLHWLHNDIIEVWTGAEWKPNTVYWSRWEPPQVMP